MEVPKSRGWSDVPVSKTPLPHGGSLGWERPQSGIADRSQISKRDLARRTSITSQHSEPSTEIIDCEEKGSSRETPIMVKVISKSVAKVVAARTIDKLKEHWPSCDDKSADALVQAADIIDQANKELHRQLLGGLTESPATDDLGLPSALDPLLAGIAEHLPLPYDSLIEKTATNLRRVSVVVDIITTGGLSAAILDLAHKYLERVVAHLIGEALTPQDRGLTASSKPSRVESSTYHPSQLELDQGAAAFRRMAEESARLRAREENEEAHRKMRKRESDEEEAAKLDELPSIIAGNKDPIYNVSHEPPSIRVGANREVIEAGSLSNMGSRVSRK